MFVNIVNQGSPDYGPQANAKPFHPAREAIFQTAARGPDPTREYIS